MIRLILDTATMRVVYFTTDLNEQLNVVDKTLMYDYAFELPSNFSHDNCWNWRLNGNKIELTETKQNTTPTIFEKNKKEVLQLLETKINQSRQPYLSNCLGGEYIRYLKNYERTWTSSEFLDKIATIHNMSTDEYRNLILEKHQLTDTILKITELNKEYYLKQIREAEDNWTLCSIRDEFCNVDLTHDNPR